MNNTNASTWKVGIDIGGTFTGVFAINPADAIDTHNLDLQLTNEKVLAAINEKNASR